MKTSTDLLNQAVERMTTGLKINHASDNAAIYSISTNMTTKIGAYMVAEDNAASALDMISTAEGTLSQIQDKLERLRALQQQASNGTYGEQSLKAINSEANALVDEINRLYSTAEYNGIKLFKAEETPAIAAYTCPRATEKKFIKDIEPADLTGAVALSSVTDENTPLASGKYTISNVEELAKLARLTNNGMLYDIDSDIALGTYEFILTDDIDLAGYGNWTPIGRVATFDGSEEYSYFTGTFNGNGHVIKNMSMVDMTTFDNDGSCQGEMYAGLFGVTSDAEIKNLGVEDINFKNSGLYAGAVVTYGLETTISNVYTTGVFFNLMIVGGIAGINLGSINDCYSSLTIISNNPPSNQFIAGGISYLSYGISNCFFAGKIEGMFNIDEDGVGVYYGFPISNAPSNSYYVDSWTTEENKLVIEQKVALDPDLDLSMIGEQKTIEELEALYGISIPRPKVIKSPSDISFQIGINSALSSQITLNTGFSLNNIEELRNIGVDKTTDFLSQIDNILNTISTKQTEYGAVQNRLESALKEISTQYENLVSSRSTIRDADIAEVSSHYIQQQILQQASATLMATANQSPAIALQLI